MMGSFIHWLHSDTAGLLTLAAVGIAVLLILIIRVKLEPFIALVISGVLVALAGGVSLKDLVGAPGASADSLLEKGFAGVLGHVVLIIGLGTVLGALLEHSGGAQAILTRLTRLFGERGTPLAMGITGFILGIPVFFDIGIFVLAPLIYVAALRGKKSLGLYALPMITGLSVTHAFLPPHPGPVAAAGLLHVDLGWIILMGFICGIPAWFVAGILWGTWIGKRIPTQVPPDAVSPEETDSQATEPGIARVAVVIGLPMLFILAGTFGSVFLPEGPWRQALIFLGTPGIALSIAVLLALWLLGVGLGFTRHQLAEITGGSLKPVGMIILVVGAGAFFGAVLQATGVGTAVAHSLAQAGLPTIVAAYVISAGLRLAQGSATVAIVTTGGIVAPGLASGTYSQPQLALIVMAIAAGSIIASHVNDGGFWIVQKYFNMSVKDTLKTWTVLETILSLVGFAVAWVLYAIIS